MVTRTEYILARVMSEWRVGSGGSGESVVSTGENSEQEHRKEKTLGREVNLGGA